MPIEAAITVPATVEDFLVIEWTNPVPPLPGPGFVWDPAVANIQLDWNAGAGDVRIFEGAGPVEVAAGWEGDLELAPDYLHSWVRARVRPAGGWPPGNYGSGEGPLLGRLVRASIVDGELGLNLETLAPAFDFALELPAAPELVADVPIPPRRRGRVAAAAYVTASGQLQRRNRVELAERLGVGVYRFTFGAGLGRALAEHHARVTVVAEYARPAVVEGDGGSLTVRTFDLTGEPADANVALAVERL